jgi:hypothetical protein
MARTGRHTPRIPLRRRFGAAVALFAYLAAAIGFPLPATFASHKDRSEPFPCRDHACGCQNAEECWSGCCCFSAEERWAWAESHHIQPPEYAEKPAPKGWRTVRLRDRERANADEGAGCCERRCSAHEDCCAKHDAIAKQTSCCGHSHSGLPSNAVAPEEPRPATDCNPAASVLRCKGLSTLWISSGVVLSLPVAARPLHSAVPDRLVCDDPVAVRTARIPPSPPPRPLPA